MRYTQDYLNGLETCLSGISLDCFAGFTVLITGASGLIGSSLADVLLAANEHAGLAMRITLAGRRESSIRKRFTHWDANAYEYAYYDAAKPVDLDINAHFIFHCAGNAHPRLYSSEPVETLMNNVVGVRNILSYAKESRSRRVLYVSSSEVYGRREGTKPYREDEQCYVDPLDPRSCYPCSKRACETLCASYLKEYGVDSVIARPGHVWGPMATQSDSRAHAQFAREASAGRNIVMKSPGGQLRSYIYAIDCAAAMLTIASQGESGTAYNVGVPGFTCTILQLAEALAKAGGVDIIRGFPTQEEKSGYNPMTCSALDCTRLADLGFTAQFTLEEAARQTIQCMQED